MINTETGIQWIMEKLKKDQSSDGAWSYPFETGLSTDAYMIILLRSLELNDEQLIKGLAVRILSRQEENGAWKLFYDEGEGNLSSTLEAYYALLYSGYYQLEDPRLKQAKQFITANGGMEAASMYTKIMLAITGQYKWPGFFPIPIEVILLPLSFLINFYQFSTNGRANLTPIMILADKKFRLKTNQSPDLSELLTDRANINWQFHPEWQTLLEIIKEGAANLNGMKEQLHLLAIERAKKYMLNHIETDGTLCSYFSSTFLMIFALLSLGWSKNDPVIAKAIKGLKSFKKEIGHFPHIQYTTANVWNTALISFALQNAGLSLEEPMIQNANQYLLKRQHEKYGDWIIHNPKTLPGGWGFSDINTFIPDVDDTTAVLRAVARQTELDSHYLPLWERGLNWLFSMQNDDGGWAAFEKNVDNQWLDLLPIEKAEFLFGDPSTADLTGRTLEFLGNYTNLVKDHVVINKAINWLLENQENDGSWYGRWGICYLYGTWAAVTGLKAVGIASKHRSIQKASRWIKNIQNEDGGWGESCLSDSAKKYVPLNESTLVHTAWALDALIAASENPTAGIQRGIMFLLKSIANQDWSTDYPKGQGMAGGLYIHYHSYRYIFPLLTLSNYNYKYYKNE